MNSVEKLIQFHEGRENRVYRCSEGALTCGIGHLLSEHSYVPEDAVIAFFKQDMKDAYDLYGEMDLDLDDVRRAAVINMCFNLGHQLKRWKFIRHMRAGNWIKAGDELKDSKWWHQVGRRSLDIWIMVMTGEWPKVRL